MSETATAAATPLGPAGASDRLAVVDALRGLALFGILAANMRGFAAPASVYFSPLAMWPSGPDFHVQFGVETLIMGKFITLFAFLFGLGFAAQFDRAQIRGASFGGMYARRLVVLLFFGLMHQMLLWWGDILVTYALLGFALMLFRDFRIDRLLRWAAILYWVPMAFMGAGVVASIAGADVPSPPPPTPESIDVAIRTYRDGSFMEIWKMRLTELSASYKFLPFYGWRVLALFLFGAAAWRSRLFHDTLALEARLRPYMLPLLLLGLIGNAIPVAGFLLFGVDPMKPSATGWFLQVLQSIGVPALSAFYAGLVVLAYNSARRILTPFACVGRMALTNYLMQSLLCTAVFYSYGLGQYGAWGPASLLLPTLVVYGLQVAFSAWWLQRTRFGPLEWLWRAITYGRPPI